MKKVILAVMVVFAFALVAIAANNGPATIDLAKEWGLQTSKKPVQFPHAVHQSKNQCTDCHVKAEGGALKSVKTGAPLDPKALVAAGTLKKGGMKNAIHDEFCWECHVQKKVPQGKSCTKCHK
ncbi:MAG: cytochrome c3 family protein [Deferribacterales bacterium]